jgi:hypothetical protein
MGEGKGMTTDRNRPAFPTSQRSSARKMYFNLNGTVQKSLKCNYNFLQKLSGG